MFCEDWLGDCMLTQSLSLFIAEAEDDSDDEQDALVLSLFEQIKELRIQVC